MGLMLGKVDVADTGLLETQIGGPGLDLLCKLRIIHGPIEYVLCVNALPTSIIV